VMLDDVNGHEQKPTGTPAQRHTTSSGPTRERELATPIHAVPMADRGMPVELARTPDVVHAWLDGEAPLATVRTPEWARHVEFWSQVDSDLETRRHEHAPADLAERIMAALPEATPRVAVPWWTRAMTINPLVVAAAAVGLLALGAAIGTTFRH
jgi:hypothetical protein